MTSGAIALVMTAGVALRLGLRKRPSRLVLYFLFFFVLEWIAEHYFLPEGGLGPEVAWVCLALSIPLFGASYVWGVIERRYEEEAETPER